MDAASWMAGASGIPPFVIGATVVSLATTLPEIIVSVMAAAAGQADMAVGNAVGSVTANTALILAVSVILLPSPVDRARLLPKALILLSAIALLWTVTLSSELRPFGSLALILLFSFFIYENIRSARSDLGCERGERAPVDRRAVLRNVCSFLFGAALIIVGSRLLVDNGALIARDILHIDERIVSLTMVAIGTSLPELVTAVSAVLKRRASLTAGNILGANIIDILLILPLCSAVQGGSLPLQRSTLLLDLPFCFLCAALMLIPALLRGRFSRLQGVSVLLLYLCYTVILFI